MNSASTAILDSLGLAHVAEVFAVLHPDRPYEVALVAELPGDEEGFTEFPPRVSVPTITLQAGRSHDDQLRIFVHELAHVAAGFDAGHGPEFEAAETEIHARVAAQSLARLLG